jgi:hypothetical protein
MIGPTIHGSIDPWSTRYEDGRTAPQDDNHDDDTVEKLLAGLNDLRDFGTAWANKAGAITIPAPARAELGLPALAHWHVLGSPTLGVAMLIGPRRSATETLAFLLNAGRDARTHATEVGPRP